MNKTLFYDEQGFFFIEPYNALEAYQIFTHIMPYVSTSATAILDRLLHHSCVLTINGDSYRLMSARKEKLLEENDK